MPPTPSERRLLSVVMMPKEKIASSQEWRQQTNVLGKLDNHLGKNKIRWCCKKK